VMAHFLTTRAVVQPMVLSHDGACKVGSNKIPAAIRVTHINDRIPNLARK